MLSFFPLDVLDEIWDVIESVSEGFLTYSCLKKTWTLFENGITPSVIIANRYPFAPMMFYYQMALLTGSDVIMM